MALLVEIQLGQSHLHSDGIDASERALVGLQWRRLASVGLPPSSPYYTEVSDAIL